MTRFNASLAVSTLMVFFTFGASVRDALGVDWIAETAPYNVDSNWSSSFVPDQEVAAITNGGTAIIDDTPPDISRLRLGNTDFGGRGTLEILSGGELFATEVEVGGSDFNTENGVGRLRIHRGAELIALTLTSEGDSSSSIVLGDVEGSGTAKLAVDERATLMRNTRIIGPNVEFTPFFLDLTSEHTLTAEITGPEHSTIAVIEEATLNDSAVHVDFSGYTPTFDDSWTLLDAFTILGEFGAISANGLPPGAGVFVSYSSGGENGEIVDLTVGTQLDLSVNRRTGAVAIENRAATESVSIQGYTIDGVTGGTSSGSVTLAPTTTIELGNIYEFTPAAIGEEGSAVTFEYEVGGETIPGRVDFTGPQNNVVLLVDPETGNAAFQNQSDFDADVDGYSIISSSGSLDAENWTSLSSGRAGWQEANPSNVHLAELNLNESFVLSANGAPVGIGSPFDFDAGGVLQDLAFEFHLNGGDTIQGIVEYGALDLVNPLDCDGDGVVSAGDLECILRVSGPNGLDALIDELGILRGDLDGNGDVAFADFLVLSASFGTTVDSYVLGDVDGNGDVAFTDFLVLSSNFGKSAPAAASVPEPASWQLIALGLSGLLQRRASRRSRATAGQRRTHQARPRSLWPAAVLLVVALLGNAVVAQTLTPSKQIFVSDTSDRAMVNADMDPGPLDDSGDIVARERRTITQDNIQIRTFMEFDLSSITTEAVANPGWSAQFVIDFVTRLNTVNDMTVVVGRVLGSTDEGNVESHPDFDGQPLGAAWTTDPGQLPLFEWGRTTGESTAPDFEEDRLVVVENVKTDPLGTRQVDVTEIVANWVNGVHDNNGFSIAGGHDEFQGAGLNSARLIVGITGDFDGNGIVDVGDFLILASNFASELDGPVTAGDIDFDGDVDLDDFGQFKAVFAANAGQAQAVPEPAALPMAGGLLVGLLAVRRRRRKALPRTS